MVCAFVPCQDVVEGGLMLSTLLPASECFRRDGCPTRSLLFDPVEQSTDVLLGGEARKSSFQGSESRISRRDFLIPGGLFIQEGLTGLLSIGFALSSRDELQLGQSRLLRGKSGESEEGGMELVHAGVGRWRVAYGLWPEEE